MYIETEKELLAKGTVHKLIITMKKHRKLFDIMREETGLGHSAHRTLMIISSTEEQISQTLLAEKLEISTAAVAVMLKKLESDGFIKRKVNSNDSRLNYIFLTDKGERIVEKSKKDFYMIDTALFEGFNDEDMTKLNIFLDKLQNNIEEIEGRQLS